MGISTSIIYDDKTQADGTRDVIEIHTDHLGVEHLVFIYGRPSDYDETAEMNARVAILEESLASSEDNDAYGDMMGGRDVLDVVNNPVHSTAKRLAKKIIYTLLRMRNDEDNLVLLITLVEPLLAYLEANYTPTQLSNFLDLTIPQLQKMNNKRAALLLAAAEVTTAETNSEEIE